jgi:hypothetical protein
MSLHAVHFDLIESFILECPYSRVESNNKGLEPIRALGSTISPFHALFCALEALDIVGLISFAVFTQSCPSFPLLFSYEMLYSLKLVVDLESSQRD